MLWIGYVILLLWNLVRHTPPIVVPLAQQNYHTLYIRVDDYESWLTLKGYSWKLCWFRIEIDLTCGTETKQMGNNERQAGVGGHYFSLQFLLLSLKTLMIHYFGNLIR